MHLGEVMSAYVLENGIYKNRKLSTSEAQTQTGQTFGFKWQQEKTYDSAASLSRMKTWLLERYEHPEKWINLFVGGSNDKPIVLDAGCGAGMSGLEYWESILDQVEYVGIDISAAIHVAKKRFEEKGYRNGIYIQDSIDGLSFPPNIFDVIFAEGVMHHTDNTQATFKHLCNFLKPGGLFMFYLYRKKGPIREFTDDYIRNKLQRQTPEQAWYALESLTKLGVHLGDLQIEVNVPEEVPLLGIPAGKIDLQRLFYWYIFKAFYDPSLTLQEMHHINFDWYAPKNAHRHTIQEIRHWCQENNLEILRECEELAGITCVARKIA